MCKVSKSKFGSTNIAMEEGKLQEKHIEDILNSSILLELAATDDASRFEFEVETNGVRLDDVGFWYGRKNGCKRRMGLEKRSPLMIAAVYGSTNVVKYIISTGKADVNKVSDSDGATALHCAAAGGSSSSVETVKLLLDGSADPNLTDDNGNKPVDLIARGVKSSKRKALQMLLKGFSIDEEEIKETEIETPRKEYPIDVSLPDINDGVYGTDEFRMYVFKVQPCCRAYSHDWTECPFVHPGENARRRDPRKHQYTCVPCPEFRKGSCVKGDSCEYAHGVFESWLHPAQYRTRLCKDETGCARKVCFFAHKVEELRPLYASTGSAVPSPKACPIETGLLGLGSPNGNLWQNKFVHVTPPALQLSGSRLKTSLNARDLEMEIQRQQMIDNYLYNNRFGEMKPDDGFGSPSRRHNNNNNNNNPFRSSFGFDSSAAVRAGSFAKQRSQSFIDRGVGSLAQSPTYSEWGSPNGKLDWGFNSDDANKLRKSASFGFRSGNMGSPNHDPDDLWAGAGLYSSSETVPQWVEQM